MKEVIRKSDIDKLSEKEQIEFYKKYFQYQHCQLNDCGYEIDSTWAIYDGFTICDDCFEWYTEQERVKAEKEVQRLECELEKAKDNLNKLR